MELATANFRVLTNPVCCPVVGYSYLGITSALPLKRPQMGLGRIMSVIGIACYRQFSVFVVGSFSTFARESTTCSVSRTVCRSLRPYPIKENGAEKGDIFMFYLNSVTIVGFVGADPEQCQARNNSSKFTLLSVATQRSWKNAGDEWVWKVEWHRVAIIWN